MGFISLDRLCGGALLERFTLAMRQIGSNIKDPNTDPEKNRSLTIKLTFKPDKSRQGLKTSISTSVSLAPPVADETMLLLGQDVRTGRVEISELNDRSQSLSFQDNQLVRADVVRAAQADAPTQGFDPETGEIIEPQPTGPIDLRKAN
ncbi:MAG: hypothetical protein PHV18_15430 [Lachnospiraceae bacterium]|nr:hypothetical protein [Lachnospiraceae bacterium]